MTIVAPGSKILVTGASGFLGAWIVKKLLEQGFIVRAAVRTPAKAEYFKTLFAEHGERLEFAYVADIVNEGAFDEAIQGDIQGIIHCASPLPVSDPKADPSANIVPAVKGTISILKSAQSSPTVRRVIIVSSVGAVLDRPRPTGYRYSEEDWNHNIIKIVEAQGRDAPPFYKYAASKMHAETAAWNWIKENNVSYDVIFTLPSLLYGPVLGETTKEIGGPGASTFTLLEKFKLSYLEDLTPEKLTSTLDFAGVQETAERHVKALLTPEAGGQRILSVGYVWPVQDVLEIVQKNPVEGITIPKFEKQPFEQPFSWNEEKSLKLLGIPSPPGDETILETLRFAVSKGWTQ